MYSWLLDTGEDEVVTEEPGRLLGWGKDAGGGWWGGEPGGGAEPEEGMLGRKQETVMQRRGRAVGRGPKLGGERKPS